jgi:hypothetical protein
MVCRTIENGSSLEEGGVGENEKGIGLGSNGVLQHDLVTAAKRDVVSFTSSRPVKRRKGDERLTCRCRRTSQSNANRRPCPPHPQPS